MRTLAKQLGIAACLGLLSSTWLLAAASTEISVELGTLHGKMKFDKEQFVVPPGAKVKLTFKNTDEMQHNWLLCKPGKNNALMIAQKAWAMGAQAVEKQFAPNDPAVLFHTRVLNPQESDTITFTAPSEPGDYPYVCTLPGHAFSMRGIMKVGSSEPEASLKDVVYLYYEGPKTLQLPDFDTLKPLRIKPIQSNLIDLNAVQSRAEHFAVQFLGELEINRAGEHTFYLASDDGSKLFINDKLVVDNDGHHGVVEKEGTISLPKGSHAVKLLFFQADSGKALRLAWKGPAFARRLLSPEPKSNREIDKEKFFLQVKDEPLVMRTFIDGGPARSIAVGLPGGINYCFNAESCAVQFGWLGMYLDIGPNRGYGVDRGGGWSKILGDRFEVGYASSAPSLRLASQSENSPSPRFLGYRRAKLPEFSYDLDGTRVTQIIQPVPHTSSTHYGLQYQFKTEGPQRDLSFKIDRSQSKVDVQSTAGTWSGDTLLIPAGQSRQFTITILDTAKNSSQH